MEIYFIVLIAFFASILTFFSGFGLGTILMPVFAIFFPVDVAIALTGIVHFANNIFKVGLVGKKASKRVLIRFGIPAIIAAFAGAWLLVRLSDIPPVYEYNLWGSTFQITPVKLIIAILLLFFSILEILPATLKFQFGDRMLVFGGLLSGFFGGLSGLQGAIRSAFLIKSGLTKEAYIGTVVVISVFVDVTRLSVYAARLVNAKLLENLPLLIAAIAAAITGAIIGKNLLIKITLGFIQKLVAVMLVLISLALGLGLI